MKRAAVGVESPSMSDVVNFFECLELPEAWYVEEQILQDAYFKKQQQWHPDRFVGRDEALKTKALQQSSLVNKAFQVLRSPVLRAEHMLELKNISVPQETIQDPELLMEMMEYQERSETATPDELRSLLEVVREDLHVVQKKFGDNVDSADLKDALHLHSKMSYLTKLERDLAQKVA